MSHLSIIPQKFSFIKPTIYGEFGELISPGMNVAIEIDAFHGDKKQIKENLSSLFAEVLEYFDWLKSLKKRE